MATIVKKSSDEVKMIESISHQNDPIIRLDLTYAGHAQQQERHLHAEELRKIKKTVFLMWRIQFQIFCSLQKYENPKHGLLLYQDLFSLWFLL